MRVDAALFAVFVFRAAGVDLPELFFLVVVDLARGRFSESIAVSAFAVVFVFFGTAKWFLVCIG